MYKKVFWIGIAAALIFSPIAGGATKLWALTPLLLIEVLLIFAWLWKLNNPLSNTKLLVTSYELVRSEAEPPRKGLVTSYGIYHISNIGSVSWYEYTKEILKLAGCRNTVTPISSGELDRPARRPAMSVLDNSKFEKFTGFKMRHWKSSLKCYLIKERQRTTC